MKHADIQKLHERRAEFKCHRILAGTRRGGSKRWRLEHLTARRGHSVHNNNNNNPEEI